MLRMKELGFLDTLRTVVPIRAVEALVANSENWLVAAITQCSMLNIASSSTKELSKGAEGVLYNCFESMSWMMAMLVGLMARDAKIEVITVNASDELVLGIF